MATTHHYTDKDGLTKFGKKLAADYRNQGVAIAQDVQAVVDTCNQNFQAVSSRLDNHDSTLTELDYQHTKTRYLAESTAEDSLQNHNDITALTSRISALETSSLPWLEVTADGLHNTLMTSGEDYTLDITQYVPANAKLSDYCGVKITDPSMGIVFDSPYIATIGENQAYLGIQQVYAFTLLPAIDLTEKTIVFLNLTRGIHENANRIDELAKTARPWFEITGTPLDGPLKTTAADLETTYSLSVNLPISFQKYFGIKITYNANIALLPLLNFTNDFYSFGLFEDSNKNLWKVHYDVTNKKLEFNLIRSGTAIKHAVWFNARSQSFTLGEIANQKPIEFTVDPEEMKAMFDNTLEQLIYAAGGVAFPPMPLTPAMMPMLFLTFDAGTVNTFYRFDFIGSNSAYIFFKGDIITEYGLHETYKATWIYESSKITFECIS